MKNPNEVARACADAMMESDAASRGLGIEVCDVGPGTSTLSMHVRDDMVNGHGICHGGFIFLLADSAFAFACNAYDERTVAASCDISFVNPASRDNVLTARVTETYRQGRNGIYDAVVTDQNNKVIAIFRGKSRTIGGKIINSQD